MKDLKSFGFNTANRFFTIAEIGINHGGNLDLAKKLIDSAARTGVDSVKLQTYLTEKRVAVNSPIFDILKQCELPFQAFEELKKHADEQGVEFFSTPFDNESVQCLEDIGANMYKVASFDVVNHKLLERIAETGKTVIMSVGMANLPEIQNAYKILKQKTNRITILHCISAYPTNEVDASLSCISNLKKEFDCVIGQSDHTNDIIVPLYAAAMGAQVLEKHYKISDDMDCIDAPVSINENQMSKFVSELKQIDKMLGESDFGNRESEKDTIAYRRFSTFQ
jgi:N,N'-diacetyllegionaminate synthase